MEKINGKEQSVYFYERNTVDGKTAMNMNMVLDNSKTASTIFLDVRNTR